MASQSYATTLRVIRRISSNIDHIRADSGSMLVTSGLSLVGFGAKSVADSGPNVVDDGPTLVDVGSTLVDFWANVGLSCPMSGRQARASIVQFRIPLVDFGPNPAQNLPTLARPNVAQTGPKPVELHRNQAKSAPTWGNSRNAEGSENASNFGPGTRPRILRNIRFLRILRRPRTVGFLKRYNLFLRNLEITVSIAATLGTLPANSCSKLSKFDIGPHKVNFCRKSALLVRVRAYLGQPGWRNGKHLGTLIGQGRGVDRFVDRSRVMFR